MWGIRLSATWSATDSRVQRTQIEIGFRNDKQVEVLKKRTRHGDEFPWEAFSRDEKVVQRDLSGLKDGQQVEVNQPGK